MARWSVRQRRGLAALALWCSPLCGAQDPLGGDYFGGGSGGPPPPMMGMSPGSPLGRPAGVRPSDTGPGWLGGLACFAAGAGAMKVFDLVQERALRRAHEDELVSARAQLSLKHVERDSLRQQSLALQNRVEALQKALYESEAEALQRDYDEFKAPDVDDDDMISTDEFAAYIHNYMKAYPHIPEEEYPTFEDFDLSHDGRVTFEEWQKYLQKQQKANKASAATQKAAASSVYDQYHRRASH